MIWRVIVASCAVLAACNASEPAIDGRAAALEGDWRLALRDESDVKGEATLGRLALVAVRGAAGVLGESAHPLAAGAVTMERGPLAQRVRDGTRVEARQVRGDSVTLSISLGRGEQDAVLTGVMHGDTVSGTWRGVLSRSSGLRGWFQMTRVR